MAKLLRSEHIRLETQWSLSQVKVYTNCVLYVRQAAVPFEQSAEWQAEKILDGGWVSSALGPEYTCFGAWEWA